MLWITSAKLNNFYIKHAKLQLALTYFHDYDYVLHDCDPHDYVLNGYVHHGYDHGFSDCVLRDLYNCALNDCDLYFFSFLFYFTFLS